MPIRSPRGRASAYRGIWQWPLRSPARLAATAVVVTVLGVGVSLGVTALGGGGSERGVLGGPSTSTPGFAGRSTSPGATGTGTAPTPTALPPVPELAPPTLPLSQAPPAALDVASRWSAAWVRPPEGTTAQQWLDGLRPTTTEEYLGVLSGVDPANIPATAVTGPPRPVRVAPRSLQVEIPTDTLTLLVLVVETEAGWRVSSYERA